MVTAVEYVGVGVGGPALVVARGAWLVVAAATVGLYVPSLWVGLHQVQGPCPPGVCRNGHVPQAVQRAFADLHLSVGLLGSYMLGLNVAFTLGFAAIAALIFWRRSRDLLALFISLALLIFGAASFGDELLPLRLANPAWRLPVGLLGFLGVAGFGAFLYVFPDGRFVPRWTFLAAVAWALWMLPIYFVPDAPLSWVTWPAIMYLGAWALFLGTFVCAQAYRYRWVSSSVQRAQTKWVVLGIVAAAAGHFGGMLVLSFQPAALASAGAVLADLAGSTLVYASVLLIPICIGIAMLRHHLFDVDVVIRQTVIYSALAATLAVLYEGAALGLQHVLLAETGGSGLAAEVAVAFSVGALAQPLHRRIERGVTRAFYPRKYEAERRIEAYGRQVHRELHLETMPERLEAAVEQRLMRARSARSSPPSQHTDGDGRSDSV